ncbi:MAG: right-handed parallel beta-helix repeat-containing protein [Bacteroidia bacterium]|nr:right-handed parallel beta-helix repeat-containing protein [Bacteroidia bacterium]
MKLTHKSLIFIFFALFLFQCAFGQEKVTVSSVEDLIEAIKSNTQITLLPGRYNLSEYEGKIRTKNISWSEVFDGMEMVVTDVENLEIKGMAGAEIVVNPRYAWVMKFRRGKNIKLSNLTMGHTEKGSCVGGVVSFYTGKDIKIENSILYGSGTEGVKLSNVSKFTFTNSVIKECTYDLMSLSNSNEVLFENSAFLNTGEFDMVIIEGTGKIVFKNCMFRDNVNGSYYPHLFSFSEGDASVKLQNCQFINNQISKFSNIEGRIELVDNVFKNNGFVIPD